MMKYNSSADAKRLNDLRKAVDAACIVVVTDSQGHIIFVNEKFCKISGYTAGELIGEKHSLIKSDNHSKKFHKKLLENIGQGKKCRTEFKEKAKDGHIYWVDTTIVPFLNEKGKPFQFIAISRDITDLKETQKLLTDWKERYEAATEAAGKILYDWDLKTNDVIWGGDYKETFGYSLKDLDGGIKRRFELIHPDDRAHCQQEIDRVLKQKDLFCLEYRLVHKNGYFLYVQDDGRLLLDEEGNVERMIGFVADITERKKMEKAIQDLPQQIIKAQEKEKERIALDIHDDLGQSLIGTKMLITSYLSEKDFQKPEIQKFGKEVLDQINYCIDKARKVSYGLVPPQLKLLGLPEAIKEMVKHISENGKINVTFKHQDLRNLKISGGEINVYRIIQEALNNILKHANASKADISMSCTNGNLDVVIKDDGKGFDKKTRRKSKILARGLGLSVMKERAKLLNGKVSVDSKPGAGTTIKINVPLDNSNDA